MTATPASRPTADWRVLLVVYWLVSLVEGIGVSQVFAFLPTYLRGMGVAESDRLLFIGIFSALIFIVGAPFVPLWGVWADKYSRKAVIIRSALVEAVVFAAVAASREPWQLALSLLLIGLQLGNTGVMLAGIRDVAPRARLGTIIAFFGVSGPIGFAVGPVLGGLIVDGAGLSLSVVFASSAVLSVLTALLLAVATPDIRPEVVPQGRVLALAYGAIRSVLVDGATRRIFAIFGLAYLASQMSRPYLPVVVERLNTDGLRLTSDIALVAGTAALAGALVSPLGGALGDRIGFRPVLTAALLGAGIALVVTPLVPTIPLLALTALVYAALSAAVSAMVFGLLALEIPAERRSTTLNLVYLPLYAAGVVGPTTGAVVVSAGVGAPFIVGGAILLLGGVVLALRAGGRRRGRPPRTGRDTGATPDDPAAEAAQAGRSRSAGPT